MAIVIEDAQPSIEEVDVSKISKFYKSKFYLATASCLILITIYFYTMMFLHYYFMKTFCTIELVYIVFFASVVEIICNPICIIRSKNGKNVEFYFVLLMVFNLIYMVFLIDVCSYNYPLHSKCDN